MMALVVGRERDMEGREGADGARGLMRLRWLRMVRGAHMGMHCGVPVVSWPRRSLVSPFPLRRAPLSARSLDTLWNGTQGYTQNSTTTHERPSGRFPSACMAMPYADCRPTFRSIS